MVNRTYFRWLKHETWWGVLTINILNSYVCLLKYWWLIRLGIQRVSFNRGIIAIHNQLDVIWDGSPAVLSTGKSPDEHLNVNIIELNEFFCLAMFDDQKLR